MPLLMAPEGEILEIARIGGREDTRRHLANLGFTVGGEIQVISKLNGNLIVKVKDSRVAIDRDLATKIMV